MNSTRIMVSRTQCGMRKGIWQTQANMFMAHLRLLRHVALGTTILANKHIHNVYPFSKHKK